MKRRVLVVLLLVATGLGPATVTAADDDRPPSVGSSTFLEAGPSPTPADVTVEFSVEPLPDQQTKIRVTATFSFGDIDTFDGYLDNSRWYDTTVQDANGFTTSLSDDGRLIELAWDGQTDPATVTYTIERPEQYREGNRYENRIASFIDGGDWMLLRDVELAGYRGPPDLVLNQTSTVDTDEPVVDGHGLSFIGDHEQYVRTGGGTEFRVIVPPAADLDPEPIEIARTLANASAELPTKPTTDTIYVYVSGGPRKDVSESVGKDMSVDDTFAIVGRADRDIPSARNTWIHEYVHVRQTYPVLEERIMWFDEGSADYLMMLFSLHQDRVSYETFLLNLRAGDAGSGEEYMDDTLSQPETYDRPDTEYEKGRRVLAALDAKLREATDGEKTILDVYARMTERDGDRLSYEEFKAIVATVAGQSFDDWLDKYTTTSAVPPVPEDPDVYVSTKAEWDSDGDGLPDQREATLETNPFLADTDGDGMSDSIELDQGTDPVVAATPSPTVSPTPSPTPSPTATPSPTPTAQESMTDTQTEADSPGFGVLLAMIGVSVAVLFRLRHSD